MNTVVEKGFNAGLGFYLDAYEEIITEKDLIENGYYMCPNCPKRSVNFQFMDELDD